YRLALGFTQRQLMQAAEMAISDHFRIQTDEGPFRSAQALADHEAARAWLVGKLSDPFEGQTVVVTHHAPHPLSEPHRESRRLVGVSQTIISDSASSR